MAETARVCLALLRAGENRLVDITNETTMKSDPHVLAISRICL